MDSNNFQPDFFLFLSSIWEIIKINWYYWVGAIFLSVLSSVIYNTLKTKKPQKLTKLKQETQRVAAADYDAGVAFLAARDPNLYFPDLFATETFIRNKVLPILTDKNITFDQIYDFYLFTVDKNNFHSGWGINIGAKKLIEEKFNEYFDEHNDQ